MVKQTAGRNALGEFAPEFARLNDDVLFGEVWNREKELSLIDRNCRGFDTTGILQWMAKSMGCI